ncbi:OmpH family outer membrane protein [Mucilaginibacter sp. Bleaf8]|uniref:OmpH family outer membrane protein n=1 Tax=Mucilaginibacter sp. Bleaf8 TaxID=2834430 RepID=UPI001BCE8D95|nr:OmpH family outer membrane protein [Mucilaginibacter sp. Bleaf8]MBS7566481.1 OmpH family outer membrane protein [Mucilaginibacter sp. Bleaf8]
MKVSLTNLLVSVTVAVGCSLLVHFFFNKKIAYIDSNKILNGYKEMQIAKKEFERETELYKERLDTLAGRVKVDFLNMEKARNNKVILQQYTDSLNLHKKQYKDYQMAISGSLREKEAALTQAALTKLNQFLKEYGKREGYDMILIANNSGTIAYAKDEFDITEIVLKEINQ